MKKKLIKITVLIAIAATHIKIMPFVKTKRPDSAAVTQSNANSTGLFNRLASRATNAVNSSIAGVRRFLGNKKSAPISSSRPASVVSSSEVSPQESLVSYSEVSPQPVTTQLKLRRPAPPAPQKAKTVNSNYSSSSSNSRPASVVSSSEVSPQSSATLLQPRRPAPPIPQAFKNYENNPFLDEQGNDRAIDLSEMTDPLSNRYLDSAEINPRSFNSGQALSSSIQTMIKRPILSSELLSGNPRGQKPPILGQKPTVRLKQQTTSSLQQVETPNQSILRVAPPVAPKPTVRRLAPPVAPKPAKISTIPTPPPLPGTLGAVPPPPPGPAPELGNTRIPTEGSLSPNKTTPLRKNLGLPEGAQSRDALLAQIQAGKRLKKAGEQQSQVAQRPRQDDLLRNALNERRRPIAGSGYEFDDQSSTETKVNTSPSSESSTSDMVKTQVNKEIPVIKQPSTPTNRTALLDEIQNMDITRLKKVQPTTTQALPQQEQSGGILKSLNKLLGDVEETQDTDTWE